ncbi:hypothetical protein MRX96_007444 [Rhipicephalus microplus]
MAAERTGRRVFVVGVGMTKFAKPGDKKRDYPVLAKEAVTAALQDCGMEYADVQQACCGYVYGDSTCGQRCLYEMGMTGIPVYNVNNNCSTGSTALLLAKQMVEGGLSDVVLALGFEKMDRGSLTSKYRDRANPVEKHAKVLAATHGLAPAPMAAQMFGAAGMEHMAKYGSTREHLAKIAQKNHRHSVHNPNSQFRDEHTLEEILESPVVFGPLTKLQCCPTSDGAAAAILVSEAVVRRLHLEAQAVEVLSMQMATDLPSAFADNSCIEMVGFSMTRKAAQEAFRRAGLTPQRCAMDRGDNTYGGKYVVNPSGGLISKGHPLGATGLAQCAELCWQLRGVAGPRQVPGARIALQHNIGIGGAVVVALYRLGFPRAAL